jgi:predicted lipid-binding transport protein (Tim44 family)
VTSLPNDGSFDPSLLVFAALAVFVIWKLRSVLGTRSDRDSAEPSRFQPLGAPSRNPQFEPRPAGAAASAENADRWRGIAEKGGKAWNGLEAIAAADPGFSGPTFIEGARKAYEMVVHAFAGGDRDTLRRLLSDEVYNNFLAEINSREARGETMESALVSIDQASVEDARALPRSNSITVRFSSKLITARKNKDGAVIEGDLERAATIVDLWTFSRDPGSRDPNWKLVATEAAH